MRLSGGPYDGIELDKGTPNQERHPWLVCQTCFSTESIQIFVRPAAPTPMYYVYDYQGRFIESRLTSSTTTQAQTFFERRMQKRLSCAKCGTDKQLNYQYEYVICDDCAKEVNKT